MKLLSPIAVWLLIAPSYAGDFWVDASGGSDAGNGTSASDAWRTITYAVSQIPAGSHNLFILPGVYDASHGEVFPIDITGDIDFIGVEGREVTILQSPNVILESALGPIGDLRGLSLVGGSRGIELGDAFAPGCTSFHTSISDMRIQGCNRGIDVTLNSGCFLAGFILVERTEILDTGTDGFRLRGGALNDPILTFLDCTIEGSGADGICLSLGTSVVAHLTIERSRIVSNGRNGVFVEVSTFSSTAEITDSLIAGNTRNGIFAEVEVEDAHCNLERSTVVDNGKAGIDLDGSLTLADSIVQGNGDDLTVGSVSSSDSLIGDGDLAGTNGNFTADPMFRDALAGDFRLTYGSPCVDAGVASAADSDIDGRPRDSDGDLDLRGASDLGAFEMPTLAVLGEVSIGATMTFEVNAAPGRTSVVWIGRGAALTSPTPTPFGGILTPSERSHVPPFVHLAGGPAVIPFTIPDNPVIIGETLSFQSLSRSFAAPAGAAYGREVVTGVVGP